MNGDKLIRPISVPLILTFPIQHQVGPQQHRYHLLSAIIHRGNLRNGRYYTLIRMVKSQPKPEDKWTLIRDSKIVHDITKDDIMKLINHMACILIYKKMEQEEEGSSTEVPGVNLH